jgi:serine/threonine protein kinase
VKGKELDQERLRRFEQEATAAAALNHPNILAVYHMGTHEGAPYLVTELLEGETLRELINRGLQSVRKAVDHGVQIARGLAVAHDKGKELKSDIADSKQDYVPAFDFAELYARLGDKDRAFENLEKTYKEGGHAIAFLKVEPELDNLHSDSRFTDLLRRVGLPQ